jgi:hypothetical protein
MGFRKSPVRIQSPRHPKARRNDRVRRAFWLHRHACPFLPLSRPKWSALRARTHSTELSLSGKMVCAARRHTQRTRPSFSSSSGTPRYRLRSSGSRLKWSALRADTHRSASNPRRQLRNPTLPAPPYRRRTEMVCAARRHTRENLCLFCCFLLNLEAHLASVALGLSGLLSLSFFASREDFSGVSFTQLWLRRAKFISGCIRF